MSKSLGTAMNAVPLSRVKIQGLFWGQWQEIIRTVTIPISYQRLKETGRIDAFRLKWKPGMPNPPHVFWDSDVAKWVETAAYSLVTHPDAKLNQLLNDTAELIASAQQRDGYLNTHFTVVEPDRRWMNLRDNHELYCAGHLMEAAVAHYFATDNDILLEAMQKCAEYIDSVFGLEEGKMRGYCGHEEIELALVKLYRLTAEERYLLLAKYFIDQRGQIPDYFEEEARRRGEQPKGYGDVIGMARGDTCQPAAPGNPMYYQNHLPVREQEEVVGHAVRALYLLSGMADVARETKDAELFAACQRLWTDVCERKMYVTGGLGPSHVNEGFTCAYDLPNETAYAETCAAVALIFFNHRMLQLDLDGRYADMMERALFNGALSGISLDGTKFFYENPLAVLPPAPPRKRQEWFGCACCPNNISRLIASLGIYMYSEAMDSAAVHLYGTSEVLLTIGGQSVTLTQETNYPWDGKVVITVEPGHPAEFSFRLRWPGWCHNGTIAVNGTKMPVKPEKGYVTIKRKWQEGDAVELTFEMPVRRVYAHPQVKADIERVALARGPLMYCLEEVDNSPDLDAFYLPRNAIFKYKFEADLLGGVGIIMSEALKQDKTYAPNVLYRDDASTFQKALIRAVPYFAWANRQPGEMLVWLREIVTADK